MPQISNMMLTWVPDSLKSCVVLQVGWGLEGDVKTLAARGAAQVNCYVDLQTFVHPCNEAASATEGVKPSSLHTAAQRFLSSGKPWPRGWAGKVKWDEPLLHDSEEWRYAVTDVTLIWQLYLRFMPALELKLPLDMPPLPSCVLSAALMHTNTAEAAAAVRAHKFIRETSADDENAGVDLAVQQMWAVGR